MNVNESQEWQDLVSHYHVIGQKRIKDWFTADHQRFSRFHLEIGDILVDFSRNHVTEETIARLCAFAQRINLHDKIAALFSGNAINTSENRPALHTALRAHYGAERDRQDPAIQALIAQTLAQMSQFTAQLQNGEWRGCSGKPIQHIVNIGIGGSYLGPQLCIQALKDFACSSYQFHFISSIDQTHLREVLAAIDPETTLFIISSKSFSTLETMTNAKSVYHWMQQRVGTSLQNHFIAVTAQPEKAKAFGIPENNIFTLWDWVGGRYSIWSAIGLPLMLMIGSEQFTAFLSGAAEIDTHFRTQPFQQNLPVLLALFEMWYITFFGARAQAIVPYAYRLRYFVPYLQQACMESNGKNIDLTGQAISYMTAPILFGDEGSLGQHAYHQLLHQSNHYIPVDFILTGSASTTMSGTDFHLHEHILTASALSQAQALLEGKTYQQAYEHLIQQQCPQETAALLAKHQVIQGNKPSNLILLKSLTPKNLGALLALYEHKIFVQGVLWNINSFDQWGVELGKEFLPAILTQVQASSVELDHKNLIQQVLLSTNEK